MYRAFPGKTWESPNLLPLADLKLCASRKCVKTKAELQTAWWSFKGIPQHTQSPSVRAGRLIGSNKFKEIYVQSLADHKVNWGETSMVANNKECRLYRISPRNSLNKEEATIISNNNNPCEGGWGVWFPELPHLLLKMVGFQLKIIRCAKTQERNAHTQRE